MRDLIICFFLLLFSLNLRGQKNDSIIQVPQDKTPSIQDELWKRIETLTLQLDAKEKIIVQQKTDSVSMQLIIKNQEARIKELETAVANANALAEKNKKEYEAIKRAVLKNDAVLYKQCLLYPLERRYSPTLINDALNTVQIFAGLGEMSDKFKEYRNTYQPLIMQYEYYNEQLMVFIQGCISYIEKREEKLGEHGQITIPKEKWLNELKALPYYIDCYVVKDNPPYKSIIYLDEIIDEYIEIVGQPGNVKSELQKLVKKLEPKQN